MAKTLGQRIVEEEARSYQGRRAELERVWKLLVARDKLPRVLVLHGPPGIGKSALAYAVARMATSQGCCAVILDSRDFRHEPEELRRAVAARCAGVWTPTSDRPLVLVFDTFEEMQDMERTFWNGFLRDLEGPTLIVLSGRQSASALAGLGLWQGLVDDLELGELSLPESRRLLRHHGVTDPTTAASIVAFAGGNPLFLTVAAQNARSLGHWDVDLSRKVSRSLIGHMTREIVDSDHREVLEAASVVRTFNQELLAAMLGREVSDSFAALCSLSIVRVVPLGARLHDLVRESVAADLRWRSPSAYQTMRHRAHTYLAGLAASSKDPGPLAQELLHLAADSSPQARFYAPSDHNSVQLRQARPDDLSRLNELCRTGVTRFGMSVAERMKQLNTDFHVAQEFFAVALDEGGSIEGFAYTVPLNSATWRVAAETRGPYFATLPEPEMEAIKAAPHETLPAVLVTGATHLPGYDHLGKALREWLFAKGRDRYALGASYIAYHLLAADCLELADIVNAGLARRATGIQLGDCLVDEWLLKFGDRGFVGWIAEALGIDSAKPYAQQVTAQELVDQVKVAFQNIHSLDALRESPLIYLLQVGRGHDSGLELRECLLKAVRTLEASPSLASRQAGALLADYYVERVGSMELVADRLRLPRTTFYRRVQRGLTQVSAHLRIEELVSIRDSPTR